MKFRPIFVSLLILSAGCSARQPASFNNAVNNRLNTPQNITVKKSENQSGSLYSNSGSLFSDTKAHEVGDLVTIVVDESASSLNDAKLENSKKYDSGLTLKKLFGAESRIWRATDVNPSGIYKGYSVPKSGDSNNLLDLGSSSVFKGAAKNSRTSALSAKIEARIVEVLPNGIYKIQGRKIVHSDGETHTLIVSGLIRGVDITSNNSIGSEYIADEIVTYDGKGVITNGTKKGFLASILDAILPF